MLWRLIDVRERGSPQAARPRPLGLPPLPEFRPEKERLPRHAFRVSTDIRHGLEGGIETLEEVHARYTLLERALCAKRWQEQTLRRMDALVELVRQEPRIKEALLRVHRRARQEDWPDTEPALGLAWKVDRLRFRLESLAREHLDMPAADASRLGDILAYLGQFLTQAIADPVSSEETVVFQGAFLPTCGLSFLPNLVMVAVIFLESGSWISWFFMACIFGMPLVFLLRYYRDRHDEKRRVWRRSKSREPFRLRFYYALHPVFSKALKRGQVEPPVRFIWIGGGFSVIMPFFCWKSIRVRDSGWFWLTRKRLVWRYRWRAPIHIPLFAIRPGGIHRLSPRTVMVSLVDGRYFYLTPLRVDDAEELVGLLKQHCATSRPHESHALVL